MAHTPVVKFTALPGLSHDIDSSVRSFLEAVRERLETYDGGRSANYRVLVTSDVGRTVSAPTTGTSSSAPSTEDGVLSAPNLHAHNIYDITGLLERLDGIDDAIAAGGGGAADPMNPPSLHPHNIHDVIGLQKTLDDITASISAGGAVVFTDLTDTPASYPSGSGGNYVMVNKGGSAIEFKKFVQPDLHQHNIWDVAGLQHELDRLGDLNDTAVHSDTASEIYAITEKASPVSADVLLIEDSAASYAKKRVQIGNLPSGGGSSLTYSVASVTTSNVSAAEDYHYLLDVSGMTADRSVVLPTPSGAGKRIIVTVTTGDDTYDLLLIGDTGVTINGGSAATEWSRLFLDGETVEFVSTSTSNWQVVHDGRIPCLLSLGLTSNITSHTTGSPYVVPFDDVVEDTGNIWDSTGLDFTPRRQTRWHISMIWRNTNSSSNYSVLAVRAVGGSYAVGMYGLTYNSPTSTLHGYNFSNETELTQDTEYEMIFQSGANMGLLAGGTMLVAREVF